ncbi:MAG: hypothetical protein ACT4OD_01800 [Candidatus Nitrosotenuis sp.]
MKTIFSAFVFVLLSPLLAPSIFGQVENGLGTINDLASEGTKWHYFETQKNDESTTWTENTRIKVADGKTTQNLTDKLFIYPTELVQDKENLYFAALSEECKGQIFCDYQDVYKISKKNGLLFVLAKNLKSSIHLSIENDFVYVSESSGNIWKLSKNNGAKELVVKGNEIIMDLAVSGNQPYWIEELSDQNNNVVTLENGQSKITAQNLKIPYDLTVQKGKLYWNEIQVKTHPAGFSEFTIIKSHDKEFTPMEFQNTSPISVAANEVNYKPYLVFDDYLFLVNNTNDESIIHMINLHNSTKYDIGVISGYDAKYLRTDGKSLFVIGANQDGFVIDRHTLPIVVPEFPNSILIIMLIALVSTIILSRFWHRSAR